MEYKLTQEDIDFLNQQGISSAFDAQPNMAATESEMAALGIEPDVDPGALPDPVAAATQMAAPQVAAAMPPPAAPVTQQQVASADTGGGFNIMDKIFGPKGDEQPNQFANLNRQQRMMLAFGAMRDAGMGLQGKESNSFSSTLKAINDQMDMGRKAKAAQAQQAALKSMLGAGGVGGDIQSQIARLSDMAVMYPSMAPGLTLKIKALQDQMLDQKRNEGEVGSAANQIATVAEIMEKIDNDPSMTTGPMALFLRNVPFTAAYSTQALIDSLQATMALDTLKNLKATGATMGALNREELQLLKVDITKLDLALGAKEFKKALAKVDNRYKKLVRSRYANANEAGMALLDSHFGSRPAWLDASDEPSGPRDGETTEEFKIRMNIE